MSLNDTTTTDIPYKDIPKESTYLTNKLERIKSFIWK